jgi:ribosomal subunit interface protein
MVLRIAGQNFDLGEALRTRIEETVAASVGKYFGRGYSGQVVLSKDGHLFETEMSLHLDSGAILECHGSGVDANSSFDQTIEKLAKQLRRYKERLKDH